MSHFRGKWNEDKRAFSLLINFPLLATVHCSMVLSLQCKQEIPLKQRDTVEIERDRDVLWTVDRTNSLHSEKEKILLQGNKRHHHDHSKAIINKDDSE